MDHAKQRVATIEWTVPLAFAIVFGWVVWHGPAYILDFGPENGQLSAQFLRTDVAPGLPPLFGGFGDIVDYLALILSPVIFAFGVATVRRAQMEFADWTPLDRASVFIGRVSMMLVVLLSSVMIYEVVLRYVFERPTIWANELSLWLAGFVFLLSGLYAMQQRSHIRIFLLYDAAPRWLRRTFDTISTVLIVVFALSLIYGGYGEAIAKFMRWETFGTAFDPPIPATLKFTVLFIVAMVAIQAVINLVSDWNLEPVTHSAADDVDAEELEMIRARAAEAGLGGDPAAPSAAKAGKES